MADPINPTDSNWSHKQPQHVDVVSDELNIDGAGTIGVSSYSHIDVTRSVVPGASARGMYLERMEVASSVAPGLDTTGSEVATLRILSSDISESMHRGVFAAAEFSVEDSTAPEADYAGLRTQYFGMARTDGRGSNLEKVYAENGSIVRSDLSPLERPGAALTADQAKVVLRDESAAGLMSQDGRLYRRVRLRTNVAGAELRNHEIDNSKMPELEGRGFNISLSSLTNVDSSNSDLPDLVAVSVEASKWNNDDTRAPGAQLDGLIGRELSWIRTEYDGGSLKNSQIEGNLSEMKLRKGTIDGLTARNCRVNGTQFDGSRGASVVLENCRGYAMSMQNCELKSSHEQLALREGAWKTRMEERAKHDPERAPELLSRPFPGVPPTKIVDCTLPSLKTSGTKVDRLVVERSKLLEWDADGMEIKVGHIKDVDSTGGSFVDTKFGTTTIDGGWNIDGADFSGADLSSVIDNVGVDWSKAITDEKTQLPARAHKRDASFAEEDTNPGRQLRGSPSSEPQASEAAQKESAVTLPDEPAAAILPDEPSLVFSAADAPEDTQEWGTLFAADQIAKGIPPHHLDAPERPPLSSAEEASPSTVDPYDNTRLQALDVPPSPAPAAESGDVTRLVSPPLETLASATPDWKKDAVTLSTSHAYIERLNPSENSVPGFSTIRPAEVRDEGRELTFVGSTTDDNGTAAVFRDPKSKEGLVLDLPEASRKLTGMARGDIVQLKNVQRVELLVVPRTRVALTSSKTDPDRTPPGPRRSRGRSM